MEQAISPRWRFGPSWPNLFTVLAAILLSANYFGIMADLDWTWQIRTGEQIVRMGSLRTPDLFSYTIHGTLVHDFEWLYEVLLWSVWSGWGLGGLKFLKMVLVATPLTLMGWRLHREGVRWHGIALAFFVACWIIGGAWNLRPLYATTIGLLLVSGWLHDHCVGRKPLTWWLPVTMLLWSNLHPGVITGQGLVFGAICWEWLNRWLKFNPPLDMDRLKRLTLIGGLGFAATFLSPDPIDRLLYPFKPDLAHSVQRYFVEMRPLYTFLESLPLVAGMAYLLAAAVLITVLVRLREFRGWELALLAGLTLLANFAVRCLADWTLIMLALAVPKMRDVLVAAAQTNRRGFLVKRFLRLDKFFRRLLNSKAFRFQPGWPIAVAACYLILTLFPPLANSLPVQNGREWPVAALDHAVNEGLQGRFFGSPDHGAYVAWRLKEQGLVYTDTRGFFFPPQLLEDSIFIPAKINDWRPRLDRVLYQFQTDYFVLDAEGPRGALWRDLEPVVDRPLFQDDKIVLLSSGQVKSGLEKLDLQQQTAQR